MAEMSNHSYHYNRNMLPSLFTTELPEPTMLEDIQDPFDVDGLSEETSHSNKKSSQQDQSKKKSRRKKKMLTGVSKQRRAANERERKRLQIINVAFKDLKGVLPLFPNENNISKIEIVRLASRTIKYLSELIDSDEMNSMTTSCSPGGSVTSDNSESSMNTDSSFPEEEEAKSFLDTKDIDLTNLLFYPDDLTDLVTEPNELDFDFKKEECNERLPCAATNTIHTSSGSTSSNEACSSTSSINGFNGFDINLFLDDQGDRSNSSNNDVFPSMLSLW